MMSNIAFQAGMNQLNSEFQKTKGELSQKKSKIDWNDFNWPPLIKVYHFSLDELKEPHLLMVKRMYWGWLLQVAHFPLNFLNAIIQVAVGYSFTRIISSILFFGMLLALATYLFHNGYRGVCENNDLLFRYKIGVLVIIAIYFVMMLVSLINFNGIFRCARLFSDSHGFAGFMCIVEIIIVLLEGLYQGLLFVLIRKWKEPTVDY